MSDSANVEAQAEGSASPAATAAAAATRTTGRTRVKSQRVLEAEDTKRFLKNQATEIASGSKDAPKPAHAPASRPKGKGKKKAEDVYCICRKDTDGPMIECGECNDWFHFACVGMSEDEAEKIHKYVCPGCEGSTGQKTTHTYDIKSFPSPSPPPGIAPAKRRKPKQQKRTSSHTPSNGPPSDDSDSEAQVESASSRQSSPEPNPKRPRQSIDAKRKPSVDRKPSITIGGLPPVRKYVRDKLAPALKGLFEAMDDEKAGALSAEVEEAIYHHFKEVIGGKETAGTRYKTQFNLLSSSMAKGLRPDLVQSITSGTLTPPQIATLTSADLASAEQLAEIEKAKQAALEQTVRAREEVASIRLGRDGFEKVENAHEKEMNALAEQEETARFRAEEAAMKALEPAESVEPPVAKSPVVADAPYFAARRSESMSMDVASPLRQTSFAINSAWGKEDETAEKAEPFFTGDQTEVDLSDIAHGDVILDDLLEEKVLEGRMTEMEEFEAKPVVWSGGITNPANPSPLTPPMSLRVVCRTPTLDWNVLLPHKIIEITGRVPTQNSLQFLNDSRLNPAKELVTVAFSLDPKATDEEILTWEEMVDYHLGRDRHAIYLPYGRDPVPPGGAKELYLIPLRPTDPSPDITDLIDGYCLPATGRTTSVFLGVFVSNKNATPVPKKGVPPKPAVQPAAAPMLPPNPIRISAAPVMQNPQLQALMASLNPTAIQEVVGGHTPPQVPYTPSVAYSTPPQGGVTPSYPPPPQGYSPYPPQEEYGRPFQPPQGPRGQPSRDPRRSDNGWGARGRGGYR